MSRIRNLAFSRGLLLDTAFTTVYTVPPEHNLIFKSCEVQQQSGSACTFLLFIRDQAGTQVEPIKLEVAAQGAGHWSGWLVVNSSDQVLVQSSVANTYFWLSGALLPFV